MKICPKCECANVDTATLCKECGSPFRGQDREDYEKRVAAEDALRQRKERRREIVKWSAAAGAGAIALAVTVAGFVLRGGWFFQFFCIGWFIIGMGVVQLIFPDAVFRFRHMFDIANIDDVRPSDFYYITTAIGAVALIVCGAVIMAGPAFFSDNGAERYGPPEGIYVGTFGGEEYVIWEDGVAIEFDGVDER